MTPFSLYKNKKIGIYGLGKTGIAAYEALKNIAQLVCYDDQGAIRERFVAHYGKEELIDLASSKWQEVDKIVLSPGVSLSHQIVKLAQNHNIPITSDIDLLFAECREASFVAITGTNGKSTTTALTAHIINSAGKDYCIGGNIGFAPLSLPLYQEGYVLELSSFQLDLIQDFQPQVAVLLNITPDHLDRHGTMESYINAKKKIFAHMDKDGFAIIGVDNDITKLIANEYQFGATLVPISALQIQPQGVAILPDNKIYDNIFTPLTITLPLNPALQGTHNRENIAASYAAARILGIEPSTIMQAIANFKGLPHRMQYVGSFGSLYFYNDSKATNAEAASKSIAALDNIYWLAGGIGKEGGIQTLKPYFKKIVKAYLFGQDKELFAKTLTNKVNFQICDNLEQAFSKAVSDASLSATIGCKNILLAPAAASYDQFENFEQRGNKFIALFKAIKK